MTWHGHSHGSSCPTTIWPLLRPLMSVFAVLKQGSPKRTINAELWRNNVRTIHALVSPRPLTSSFQTEKTSAACLSISNSSRATSPSSAAHLASENPRFSKSFQASPEITKVNSLNADPSSGCRSSLICQKESSSLRSPIRKVLKRSRSRQHRNCSVPHTSTISKKSFTTRATGLHCFPAVNSSGFLCCGLLLSNLTSCFSTK